MIFNKHKIVFVAIPKTASTSISFLLGSDVDIVYGSDHYSLKDIYDFNSTLKNESYEVVTCVRNPYDRFVSAYEHMKRNDNLFGCFDIIGKVNDLKYKVENNPRTNGWDEHVDDQVWMSQSYWVSNNSGYKIDTILRFESLESDINNLIKRHPTIENELQERNIGEYTPYELTQDEKDAIYDLYQEDFELFGYSK